MKLKIFNFETKELINKITIPEVLSLFDIENILISMQKENDILGIGNNNLLSIGLTSYVENGLSMTNMSGENANVTHTSRNSCMISSSKVSNLSEPKNVKVLEEDKEKELDLKLGFVLYPEGFVLNVGKSSSNFLGVVHMNYLRKITSKNIYSTSKCFGKNMPKLFKDYGTIIKYIEKNKESMCYCVSNYGYKFSLEPFNIGWFEEDFKEAFTSKQWEKQNKSKEDLFNLLNMINGVDETIEKRSIPTVATPENMLEEAILRMKELNLYSPCINKFKNGKLMFSEFGGILYDVDDAILSFVDNLKEKGYLPYHIVVTNTTLGKLANILYVSNNPKYWDDERITKDGTLFNCCCNLDCGDIEYGYSQFISSNGGVQRIV